MQIPLRPPRPTASGEPGRNDPCPCGSGRKYKHCCAGKPLAAAPPRPAAPDFAELHALRDAGRFLEAARLAQNIVTTRPDDAARHAELGLVHLHAGRAGEALPALLRAVRMAPQVAAYHEAAGVALEMLGRDGEAMTAYRTAIARDARLATAHERLGNLLRIHERDADAAACFRRAAAVAPPARRPLDHGKALMLEGKHAEAEPAFAEAVAAAPDSAEARRALAAILREQGRFEEAIPHLEAATAGTPAEAAAAYFDLVNSKRITEADQSLLGQIAALLDYQPLPESGRQTAHFALGKAYDDLGNHEAAMKHFDAGNRIASRRRPFDRAQFGAGVNRIIASTSKEFFAAHGGGGTESDLPLLIVGMPRSGSTLIEQILSSHRDVEAGNELTFWNRAAEAFAGLADEAAMRTWIDRTGEEYTAQLRRIGPAAARVTDKTPGNYLWLGLYHLALPRARIIHCRRHPVDTCLSNYFTNFMTPMAYTYDKGDLAFSYRAYRRLMAHWRTVLPAHVLFEIDYEELVADPEPVTRRLIDFLGLDWDPACLRPEENRRAVRTASQWQVRQKTYRGSVDRWRRYEPWLGELAELLDEDDSDGPVHPQSENAAIPRARRLREEGRFDEAIAVAQEALRADGRDAVLWCELGTLFLAAGRPTDAEAALQRALGLDPNFAIAHYNLGAALERLGQPDAAVAALRRAIALAPDLGGAYSRLGNLLQAQGAEAEARDCFRRARELLTGPADRDLEEAKLLRAEGRNAEAEERLRRVVSLDPANSLAHAMLGDALGESGRFEEAIAHLRKATELDPDRVGAWHNMTILRKIGADDRPLVAQMEAMLERPGRPDFERALLHFALGKAHDDLGDPARAIAHFDAANALEHRRHPFDRAGFAAQIDRLIATFSPDTLARHVASGTPDELPVFILGMPRSGTTLVEQILSAHPAVAAGGELTFWTEAANAAPATLAADYLALLQRIAPEAARVTDKNPFNFLTLGLIHAVLPQARVIHCRRDPIDTCLSIYFTRFATPQPFAYDRGDLVFYYRQYARLMAHWRAALPADRFLEVNYEDLTAAPEAETRRMVGFCGLPWDDSCLAPERNARSIRTASVWQARQPVYRRPAPRWQRYEQWLGELRALQTEEAGQA